MNCNPTITAENFKTIHNALCSLDGIENETVAKLVEEMRGALAGAYEQENSAFEIKMDYFDRVREELGLSATWSMYEVDNLSDPHPFEGATIVVYKDWNTNKDVVVQINGLTWAALYVAANSAINNSTDNHHSFIEGFTQSSIDPTILFLSTGS
jgi:hypothetical protein